MEAASAPNSAFKNIVIPTKSPNLEALATKFRAAKLSALETSPTEWIYSHAAESHHPLSIWTERLVARQNTIVVCVALPSESVEGISDDDALLQGEWVGFVALRGPMAYDQYYAEGMTQTIPEHVKREARWHMYDLYMFPPYRGKRAARTLIEYSFKLIAVLSRHVHGEPNGMEQTTVRLRCFVNPKNVPLVQTYERDGFKETGRITLREGLEANGMAESVPDWKEMGKEEYVKKYETRYGMAMEKVVEV